MTLQFYYLGINEDDAKLSYEVAHRLILKLAEYVTEKAANPVKVSRNIMINQNLPKLQSCRSCIVVFRAMFGSYQMLINGIIDFSRHAT